MATRGCVRDAGVGTGGETPLELAGGDARGTGDAPRAGWARVHPPHGVTNPGVTLHRVGIYARVRVA